MNTAHAHDTGPALQITRRPYASRHIRTPLPRGRADGVDADGSCGRFATGGVETSRRAETCGPRERPPRRPRNALHRKTAGARAARRLDERLRRLLERAF